MEPHKIIGGAQIELSKVVEVLEQTLKQWDKLRNVLAREKWPTRPFGDLVHSVKRQTPVESGKEYKILAMSWYAKGLYVKHIKDGSQIKSTKLYKVSQGDFVYNRLFAWKGSFAEVEKDVDACYVSNEFPCFEIDTNLIAPGYLWAYFAQPEVWQAIENMSSGTSSTSRLRFKEEKLGKMVIPVPPREIQTTLAKMWIDYLHIEYQLQEISHKISEIVPAILERSTPFRYGG